MTESTDDIKVETHNDTAGSEGLVLRGVSVSYPWHSSRSTSTSNQGFGESELRLSNRRYERFKKQDQARSNGANSNGVNSNGADSNDSRSNGPSSDKRQTFNAVNAVDLEVPAGQTMALIGPSGCGKSSLLRAVAGLVSVSAGSITWNGSDLLQLPTHQRGIGFMFQSHALFGDRSVFDNVAFGLKIRGHSEQKQRERVTELLEMVGLSALADRLPKELSGGESQRVALARALAPKPDLLLLDEPLAAIDRALRRELNHELALLLNELGQTAIYVTHDQHEAFSICDQIAVMDAGSVIATGSPEAIWSNPKSEKAAVFLGLEPVVRIGGKRWAVRPESVEFFGEHRSASQIPDETPVATPEQSEAAKGGFSTNAEPHQHKGLARLHSVIDGGFNLGGELVRIGFVGDRYEVTVSLDAGSCLALEVPTDSLVRGYTNRRFALGDHMRFRFNPDKLSPI